MFNIFKKNLFTSVVALVVILSTFSLTSFAQYRDKRSFLERHRTAVTIGGGTVGGAAIGGLAGGRKGALIGGLIGAGGSSIFELIRHKKENNRRYSYGTPHYRNETNYSKNQYNKEVPRY